MVYVPSGVSISSAVLPVLVGLSFTFGPVVAIQSHEPTYCSFEKSSSRLAQATVADISTAGRMNRVKNVVNVVIMSNFYTQIYSNYTAHCFVWVMNCGIVTGIMK